MPKLKTNKAIKKRFKITKTGKVLSRASLHRHLMADRSSKKKRHTRRWRLVDRTDKNRVIKSLPYGR